MNRAFKWIATFLSLLCVASFAYAQDNAQLAATDANDSVQSAIDRTTRWLAASYNANATNCNQCHSGNTDNALVALSTAGLRSDTAYAVTPYLISPTHDPFTVTYSALSGNSVGMTCGEYQITDLNDSLLRTHLRLKDRPALVVINAPSKEGVTTSLETGDVLLSTNEEPVENILAFRTKMDQDPKAKVQLKLLREGKEINQTVQASELGTPPKIYRIGVRVESPNDAMRSQLNLLEKEGLLIVEVLEDPQAEGTGLMVHDVLLRVNETRLTSFEELKGSINQSQGREVEIALIRKGKELRLKVTPYVAPAVQWLPINASIGHGIRLGNQCPVHRFFLDTGHGPATDTTTPPK
jgi:C-terminal processing protease CtpA/Prc